MNKSDMINAIADSADISKAAAGRALDGFLETLSSGLAKGDSLQLMGFGTFSVADRASRTGRNPKTGEEMIIAASKVVKFKPGRALKDAVN
ncbi:MAG: DNA-binding protein HU [Oleiphilus sp.]|nr:MAG: DNA-binding protein HU [Oleiphilus sp.]